MSFPRSSTQATILTKQCSQRESCSRVFHLLSLSRPLDCSFGGRRCSIFCPLTHSTVLASGHSTDPTLGVMRSLPSFTGLVRVYCSCWGWCSGWRCRGRHNLLNYAIFIMRAQYTLLLILCRRNKARQGSIKSVPCTVRYTSRTILQVNQSPLT